MQKKNNKHLLDPICMNNKSYIKKVNKVILKSFFLLLQFLRIIFKALSHSRKIFHKKIVSHGMNAKKQ